MTRYQDHTAAAALTAIAHGQGMTAVPFTLAALEPGSDERPPGRVASWAGRQARRFARYLRSLWRALPGPWPVKALLIALAVAEPGPWGEIALAAYANAVAARRARQEVAR
jgi:hypothetical protein